MKLLIHACCADCLLHIDTSKLDSVKPDIYFYNPNIHPRTEYLARLEAIKSVYELHKDQFNKLIIANWVPKEYFNKIPCLPAGTAKSKSQTPITRCPNCWLLRLDATFKYAKENKYDAITSTMLTSHYMNRDAIINIGKSLSSKYGIEFLDNVCTECEVKTGGFYKQNYCGCCYSLVERMEEKFLEP